MIISNTTRPLLVLCEYLYLTEQIDAKWRGIISPSKRLSRLATSYKPLRSRGSVITKSVTQPITRAERPPCRRVLEPGFHVNQTLDSGRSCQSGGPLPDPGFQKHGLSPGVVIFSQLSRRNTLVRILLPDLDTCWPDSIAHAHIDPVCGSGSTTPCKTTSLSMKTLFFLSLFFPHTSSILIIVEIDFFFPIKRKDEKISETLHKIRAHLV